MIIIKVDNARLVNDARMKYDSGEITLIQYAKFLREHKGEIYAPTPNK